MINITKTLNDNEANFPDGFNSETQVPTSYMDTLGAYYHWRLWMLR